MWWTQLTIAGVAFQDVAKGRLFPTVSMKKAGEHVLVNFGQTPFVYNIDDLMRVSFVWGVG